MLNLVCHGTNFQQALPLATSVKPGEPTQDAVATWEAYAAGWLRIFGPPEVLITQARVLPRRDSSSERDISSLSTIPSRNTVTHPAVLECTAIDSGWSP